MDARITIIRVIEKEMLPALKLAMEDIQLALLAGDYELAGQLANLPLATWCEGGALYKRQCYGPPHHICNHTPEEIYALAKEETGLIEKLEELTGDE